MTTIRNLALITAATCAAFGMRGVRADVIVEVVPPNAQPVPAIGTVTDLLPRGCASFYWHSAPYFECAGVYYRGLYVATGRRYVVVPNPTLPPPAAGFTPPPPPPSNTPPIEQNPPPMGTQTL